MTIKVKIAEREYPLRVKTEEDEEHARKAAKEINDGLQQLRAQYAARDMQDLLAAVALNLAVRLFRLEGSELPALSKRLNSLNDKMNHFLNGDIDADVL
jgi:cell division protein ZapA